MSLSYKPLIPILVRSPLSEISNQRYYAVLKTGLNKTEKIWTSTSISNSSIQWSCPPPSAETFTSRTVLVKLPVRIALNSTNNIPANAGVPILYKQFVAPRFMPISGSIDTLRVSINGLAVSIDMADVIHAFTRYNTAQNLKTGNYSMSASFADQAQDYNDLVDSNKNPLLFYGDGTEESTSPRCSNFFRAFNVNNTTSFIDMVMTENLFLSPLYFGEGEGSSFYNVNTFDINMNFLNNANRFISLVDINTKIPSLLATFNNFNNPTFTLPNEGVLPEIYFTYVTPGLDNKPPINMPISYSYSEVLRYQTSVPPLNFNAPANTITTNSIQLSSIPRRIYIYVRPDNNSLYGATGYKFTDTYMVIDKLNIQFGNQNGYFSSASPQQLYQMSRKNGLCLTYPQFRGGPVYANFGPMPFTDVAGLNQTNELIGTVGSIICITMGEDICGNDIVPGLLGQWIFQAQITYRNVNTKGSFDNIPLAAYVVVVNEGVFTIPNIGSAVTQIGVLSHRDVLDAKEDPFFNYETVMHVSGAGNFLSGLRKFGEKIYKFGKAAAPYIKDAYEVYKTVAPVVSSAVTGRFGMGEEGGVNAGVMLGGRDISREELRRRMMKHR